MLKNTKSIFILKKFFAFVDEKNKLDIIKYNKNMQNILDISLINYKIFSGRYIIYGKNGKGKEYDYDDKLLFEGEYLNKKKNGKGREYDKYGNLIFEAEYLNGKRNGNGKEYNDYDGKLIFEGEYLNGNKWNGNGYDNNNIVYTLKDGKGLIKEYYDNGRLYYEGEYLNGKRNGKGKEYNYKDSNSYLKFETEKNMLIID